MAITVGLGFGDEGKGRTVSYLCSLMDNPLVVRFNGGHQAGHQVHYNGNRHIFSNFGSGTLQGVPTYWSKYCTFYPLSVFNEYNGLKKLGITPILYVHPLCPVTTLFDVVVNRKLEEENKHGSCGVGFGATIQRNEHYYKLFVQDLFYASVLEVKLNNIASYYKFSSTQKTDLIVRFIKLVEEIKKIITVQDDSFLINKNLIFEGAQGILLDQDFGFFPNVTRSNTTSKNAIEISKKENEIYYITRSYQTRHGNGFMSNEGTKLELINNKYETNKQHEYQGEFRTGILDIDMLNYALECDNNFSKGYNKNLVITCIDQTGEIISITQNGNEFKISVYNLPNYLNTKFKDIFYCTGDKISDVNKFAKHEN